MAIWTINNKATRKEISAYINDVISNGFQDGQLIRQVELVYDTTKAFPNVFKNNAWKDHKMDDLRRLIGNELLALRKKSDDVATYPYKLSLGEGIVFIGTIPLLYAKYPVATRNQLVNAFYAAATKLTDMSEKNSVVIDMCDRSDEDN